MSHLLFFCEHRQGHEHALTLHVGHPTLIGVVNHCTGVDPRVDWSAQSSGGSSHGVAECTSRLLQFPGSCSHQQVCGQLRSCMRGCMLWLCRCKQCWQVEGAAAGCIDYHARATLDLQKKLSKLHLSWSPMQKRLHKLKGRGCLLMSHL